MVSNDDNLSTLPDGEEPVDPDATVPSPDELFQALADPTRRRVAWYLESEPEATTDELADVVVDSQFVDTATASGDGRERVAIALHHVHLPRLDAAGLVDYDAGARTVSLASLPSGVHDLVEFGYDYQRTAGRYDDPTARE